MNKRVRNWFLMAVNIEAKAEAIGKIGSREAKRDFVRLKIKVAALNQRAYKIPVADGALVGAANDPSYKEMRFLAGRVRMSSHELLSFPPSITACRMDYQTQLQLSLDGLALLGSSDTTHFFGSHKLNATYARTLDELNGFDKDAALGCLDRFDDLAENLTPKYEGRSLLLDWIAERRDQLTGATHQFLSVSELPAKPAPHPMSWVAGLHS